MTFVVVDAGMNVNVWDVTDQIDALIRARRPIDPARLADTSGAARLSCRGKAV